MPKYKEAGGIVKIDTSKTKIELNLHAEKIKATQQEYIHNDPKEARA